MLDMARFSWMEKGKRETNKDALEEALTLAGSAEGGVNLRLCCAVVNFWAAGSSGAWSKYCTSSSTSL